MAEKEDFVNKTIDFLRTEVCPLTEPNKCKDVIEDYKKHENPLKLVDDVFNVLMKCDEKYCIANKDIVKKKLESYIEKNTKELL